MSVKLRWRPISKGKRAYLDIYRGKGLRHAEFINVTIYNTDSKETKDEKESQANIYRSKREIELASSDTGILPKHRKEMSFLQFCDSEIKKYKSKDVRKLHGLYGHIKFFLPKGNFTLTQLNKNICEDFLKYLTKDSGLSKETSHSYWTKFKYLLKRAENEGYLAKNPARDIRFKGASKMREELHKQILTSKELKTLSKTYCGNQDVKDAFLFACFTGLGAAEIRQLKPNNVSDKLNISRGKSQTQILNSLPKPASEILKKRRGKKYYFELPSDTSINKNIKNWVKRAKIEKHITFYCARHTFAVLIMNNTKGDLKTTSNLLGQSSTQYTMKYLKYTDELKEKAVRSLDSVL